MPFVSSRRNVFPTLCDGRYEVTIAESPFEGHVFLFKMFDAKTASVLKRIITNQFFRRAMSIDCSMYETFFEEGKLFQCSSLLVIAR